jgi:hypothetical protein
VSNTGIKIDVAHIEHEALKFYLSSVKQEINDRFNIFNASVDNSARLPQLSIREKGKI